MSKVDADHITLMASTIAAGLVASNNGYLLSHVAETSVKLAILILEEVANHV